MKLNSTISVFAAFLIFSTCQPTSKMEGPRPPRVMRSVLDQQIRMLTLTLHPEAYAAYNTQNCALYKVWKGGVHWDGAAFNNIKTVQPESWGLPYLEKTKHEKPWHLEQNGEKTTIQPQFKGYQIIQNQIKFKYQIDHQEGSRIVIFETPEFFFNKQGKAIFQRTFDIENLPINQTIWNGEIALYKNGTTIITESFEPLSEIPDSLAVRDVSGAGSQYWLDRSGCNTCHYQKEKMIGPSYQQIANHYVDNEETVQSLVSRVKLGSTGTWGKTAMIAHPDIPEDDIEEMIYYILSLRSESIEEEEEEVVVLESIEEDLRDAPRSLIGLHPSLKLSTIRPAWFKPRVGGMDFLPDGRLLLSTWDSVGAVFALSGVETGDTNQITIQQIASGLSEPLGLKVVEGEIFVLQKHELTQLIDLDGDDIIDEYRNICNSFGATPDFHEFSYGLEFKNGYFYANLGLAMRLMSHELQNPERGTTLKISPEGSYEVYASGMRQCNGIGQGPNGVLFTTENQGQWVPASKVIHIQESAFYGCEYGMGDRHKQKTTTAPAVWLPQDEIGNSPSQPVLIPNGLYKGQLLHGDVTHGGLKRVFLEKINGQFQGVVFRFTQGLEAGINRAVFGPDGALYVGGVGMNGNWGWKGKQFGLQRLEFTQKVTFEIFKIESKPDGFELIFTEALAQDPNVLQSKFTIQQWHYETTPSYGGDKLDLETLSIEKIEISEDRKRVHLVIPKLKTGHVIYFRLASDLSSISGQKLWNREAWYTLNQIPTAQTIQ